MHKRTILVTGGAGHVGSHVVEELVKNPNNKVISLDNYFNGSIENHIPKAHYIRGHTKDIGRLIGEIPDVVYHLGEYARITPSFLEPGLVMDFNTTGTAAIVEFCRLKKVPKLVYAASSTKFADNGMGRHQSPYAFTKSANVDLIRGYGDWYKLSYAICYFYNAFGPREKADNTYGTVIANFQRAYLSGKSLSVTLPGTQKRNFTYVGDLAHGIILAGEKGMGDGYALNNLEAYSIDEIAKAFGSTIKYIAGNPGRMESGDSPTKARDELGWETTISVMDYIKDFIATHPR